MWRALLSNVENPCNIQRRPTDFDKYLAGETLPAWSKRDREKIK